MKREVRRGRFEEGSVKREVEEGGVKREVRKGRCEEGDAKREM